AGLADEYPLAAAERDRVHGEDVLIDEPETDEGLGGADTAGDAEVLSRLLLLPAHRAGQLVVVVDDEQFGVLPRDGLLPVGDEDGVQPVDCSGEGALVGWGLRVA